MTTHATPAAARTYAPAYSYTVREIEAPLCLGTPTFPNLVPAPVGATYAPPSEDDGERGPYYAWPWEERWCE